MSGLSSEGGGGILGNDSYTVQDFPKTLQKVIALKHHLQPNERVVVSAGVPRQSQLAGREVGTLQECSD